MLLQYVSMSDTPSIDYQALFDALPGRHIAFLPDDPDFTLIAENKAHQEMAMVRPGEIIGKPFFEAFPDTTEKFKNTGVSDLAESIRNVIRTGKPDTMPLLHYDIKDETGKFVTRYWEATHYPLFDADGKLTLVFQDSRDVTDEVISNDRMKKLQAQLDQALQVGQIATWSWDLVNDRVTGDKRLAALFGVSEEKAASGMPLSIFVNAIHKDDRQRVKQEITATLESGDDYQSEYRTVSKDGVENWVLARGRIEKDAQGKPVSFPGALVTITGRKQAEFALLEREKEFTMLADNMPNLAWMADAKGNVYWYNSRWYEYTGMTKQDMQGWGWQSVLDNEVLPEVVKKWRNSLKSGEPFSMAFPIKGADGVYRHFLTRVSPLKDDAGKTLRWFGTNTDIAEQKHVEDNLRFLSLTGTLLASSLDYHVTLPKVAQTIVPELADWCTIEVLNEDGILEQVAVTHKDPNKVAWAKELRQKQGPPDLSGNDGVAMAMRTGEVGFYPVITDDMLVAAAKDKQQLELLRGLGMVSVMIVPLKVRDEPVGTISLISAEQKRIFNEADLATGKALSGRASLAMTNAAYYREAQTEIAARKKLEDDLRIANEELERRVNERTVQLEATNVNLERSNQELQDFAYVASHDLQEPLRKIQAFGNLLEDEYADKLGDGKDYLDRMRSAAKRMSALIEDILSFSRVTTKARGFEPIDLTVVAREVLEDLETRIKDTGATVVIDKLPVIDADAMQLRQLLQNLIANALKFHKPDEAPVVKLHAAVNILQGTRKKICTLRIEDNGVGFDEKYLDRIFAVFQRLHGRDSYEGTGIGLAVCRKIVERHGGTITAESKPGHGATFIVNLPVHHKKGETL